MNATEIDYKSLLQKFCTHDELRPGMMYPAKQGNFYYATDAHILAFLPVSEAELTFEIHKHVASGSMRVPNFEAVIPTIRHEPKPIIIERLENILKSFPLVDGKKSCTTCDGNGYQECDLGHEHECEDCEGSGEMDDVEKKVFDDTALVEIYGQVFAARLLSLVVQSAKTLNVEEIQKVSGSGIKAGLFTVGVLSILVMPHQNLDNWPLKKYK